MGRLRILGITLYLTLIQAVCFAEISETPSSIDATKTDTFDKLQEVFMGYGVDGAFNLQDQALYLIGIFAIISLCTNWALYTGEWRLNQMIGVVIKTSFFIMLALSWSDLLAMIFDGFRTAGLVAAGGTDVSQILKPSAIVSQGDVLTKDLAVMLNKGIAGTSYRSIMSGDIISGVLGIIPKYIIAGLTFLVVKGCFFWIAFSLVLVNIEFSMFTCITMLMMPFGMLRWTETYFNKAINGVFHFGVKMMVMYFLLLMLQANTNTFTWLAKNSEAISVDLTIGDMFNYMALIFLTALLVWLLPELAAGLLDGTPNISAGSAVAGAGRAVGLTRTGWNYGKGAVNGAFHAGRAIAGNQKVRAAAAWIGKWIPH